MTTGQQDHPVLATPQYFDDPVSLSVKQRKGRNQAKEQKKRSNGKSKNRHSSNNTGSAR